MSGPAGGDSRAEPNLTPILDMVFQLITFFMLLMNFKSSAMDLDLKLPVVGSAQPVDGSAELTDLLVLNINKDGVLKVQGHQYSDLAKIDAFIKNQGQAAQLTARGLNSAFKPGDDLPTPVMIRADRSTPFHLIYRVVKDCQQQGFRKFNYMAENKEKTAEK